MLAYQCRSSRASFSVGLSAAALDGFCALLVPVVAPTVARDADRWTMVRAVLDREGDAVGRSIICRFAGGGWP